MFFDRELLVQGIGLEMKDELFESCKTNFGKPENLIVLLVFNTVQRIFHLYTTDSPEYRDNAMLNLSESRTKGMPAVCGNMQIAHSISKYGSTSQRVKISFSRPVCYNTGSVIDGKYLHFFLTCFSATIT